MKGGRKEELLNCLRAKTALECLGMPGGFVLAQPGNHVL
jgi:hypothetical protein